MIQDIQTLEESKELDKKVKLIQNFQIYLQNEQKGHKSALSLLTEKKNEGEFTYLCLLYTSDAADE